QQIRGIGFLLFVPMCFIRRRTKEGIYGVISIFYTINKITKKIKIEKPTSEAGEAEVKEAIDNLRQDYKEFIALSKTTAAKKNNAVLIDAVGSIDGKEFPEGKVTDKQLTLGANEFIPGFEDGLIGVKAGDKKTLDLTFPKEYWKKELAGKKVKFDVTVKEVSDVKIPAVDDELAKKFQLKDLKDLNTKVKESIIKHYEDMSHNLVKKDLFDYLDKQIKIDTPKSLVEKELEFLNKNPDTPKETIEKNRELSIRRVKIGLILSDFAKKKKIEISKEEVNTEVGKQLRSMPGQEQVLLDYYKNNPQALESIRGKILEDKSVELLLKESAMTEKKVTPKELTNLFQSIK
ncbi:MAG: trigger factor, partial [Alphaproteobacteria bacterium]|nr:trigger factor [Alphaproteobacteria bacterium]